MSQSETSKSILQAARELFAEKGFSNISTRQIAKRAGVNEVTLFRHFGTKAALYEAVFEYFGSTSGVYASFDPDSGLPASDALLEFGISLMKFFERNELLIRMEIREMSFLEGKTIPVSIIADRNKRILADFLVRNYNIPATDAVSLSIVFLCSIWGIYMGNHVFRVFHPMPDTRQCVETAILSMTEHLEKKQAGGMQ